MVDLTRGKRNKIVGFFIGLLSVVMLALGCLVFNVGPVSAKVATTVDISDTLSVANWGIGEGQWWGGDN